jgi:hypothetical protein
MTAPPAANATTMEIERKNRPRMIVSLVRLTRPPYRNRER